MKKIEIADILPLEEYKLSYENFRSWNIQNKKHRRVHLGDFFTFLFENRETLIYQIQEMIRVEQIQNEKAIQHEIDTYNQLLPEEYTLSSTLLLEIEDPEYRKIKLKELLGLEEHLFINIDGEKRKAIFDDEQLSQERISSVQFIRFPLGEKLCNQFMTNDNVEIISSHPHYSFSSLLSEEQLEALRADFKYALQS